MSSPEELFSLVTMLKVMHNMRLKKKRATRNKRQEITKSKIRRMSRDPLELDNEGKIQIKIEKDELSNDTNVAKHTCTHCEQCKLYSGLNLRGDQDFNEFADKWHKLKMKRQNILIREMQLLQKKQIIADREMEEENRQYWKDLILNLKK